MLSLHFFTQSCSFPTFHHPISHNNSSTKIVAPKLRGKQKSQFISNSSPQNAESSSTSTSSVLSLLCPLLKFFSSPDPSQERNNFIEVATSSLSTLARLPWGSTSIYQSFSDSEIAANHPPMPLQLYEFEACPFCRRVREAITELDLSVEVYPCPKGSRRHREIVKQLGGKEQYPFLVDPNNGVLMYESGDIVKYLFEKYGQGRTPSVGLLESTLFTGWVPTILRAGRGMSLWEKSRNEPPPKKLELFSYETNPVPYLIDPNNDKHLGDYTEILTYLFQTYSSAA